MGYGLEIRFNFILFKFGYLKFLHICLNEVSNFNEVGFLII